MSLRWDLTNVENEAELRDEQHWPLTSSLILSTVNIGIGDWTESNAAEVYGRLKLLEAVYGAFTYSIKDDRKVDHLITFDDVKRLIGLHTNVGKPETRASFIRRHCDGLIRSAIWDFERNERNLRSLTA